MASPPNAVRKRLGVLPSIAIYLLVLAVLAALYYLNAREREKLAYRHAGSSLSLLAASAEQRVAAIALATDISKGNLELPPGASIDDWQSFIQKATESNLAKQQAQFIQEHRLFRGKANIKLSEDTCPTHRASTIKIKRDQPTAHGWLATISSCRANNTRAIETEVPVSSLIDVTQVDANFDQILLLDSQGNVLLATNREEMGPPEIQRGANWLAARAKPELIGGGFLFQKPTDSAPINPVKELAATSELVTRNIVNVLHDAHVLPDHQVRRVPRRLDLERPDIVTQVIGGEEFVFFIHPSRAPLNAADTGVPDRWYYVGVTTRRGLAEQAQRVSARWGLCLSGLLIIGVASLPFLKLGETGLNEATTLWEFRTLLLCVIVLSSLTTLGLGYAYTAIDLARQWDRATYVLAAGIRERFKTEARLWSSRLRVAAGEYHKASYYVSSPSSTENAAEFDRCYQSPVAADSRIYDQTTVEHLIKSPATADPPLELAFGVTTMGHQTGPLLHLRQREPSYKLNLGKRRYFHRALAHDFDSPNERLDQLPFTVQRVFGYDIGRRITAIATPWSELQPLLDTDPVRPLMEINGEDTEGETAISQLRGGWSAQSADPSVSEFALRADTVAPVPHATENTVPAECERAVFGIASEVRSFERAILPQPFQFAVLDNKRDVIFHSNDNLSLVENFATATRNNPALLGALARKNGSYVNFGYHGEPQRGLVMSLDESVDGWDLVVYFDRGLLDMVGADVLLMSGVLICVYLVFSTLTMVALAMAFRAWSGYHLFPIPRATHRRLRASRKLSGILGVLTLATLAMAACPQARQTSSGWAIWMGLFAVTIGATLLMGYSFYRGNNSRPGTTAAILVTARDRGCFRGVWLLLLALWAIIPALVAIAQSRTLTASALVDYWGEKAPLNEAFQARVTVVQRSVAERLQYVHGVKNVKPADIDLTPWTYRVLDIGPSALVTGGPLRDVAMVDYTRGVTDWHTPLRDGSALGNPTGRLGEKRFVVLKRALVAVVVFYLWVWLHWGGLTWLCRRLAAVDAEYSLPELVPPEATFDAFVARRTVVLDRSGATWAKIKKKFAQGADLDCRLKPESVPWRAFLLRLPGRSIWTIDHLEEALFSAEGRSALCELLQDGASVEPSGSTIVVRSEVLPDYWLESARVASKLDPDRWEFMDAGERRRLEGLFARFDTYRTNSIVEMSVPSAPSGDATGADRSVKDELTSELLQELHHFEFLHQYEARAQACAKESCSLPTKLRRNAVRKFAKILAHESILDFRRVWRYTTRDERLVLHDLARGHLINPRNREPIRSLLARGILTAQGTTRGGPVGIASRSFAAFVENAEPAERWLNWERERDHGSWARIRGPLYLALVILAGLLLFQFRQQIDAFVAAITGLVTLIPLIERVTSAGRAQHLVQTGAK